MKYATTAYFKIHDGKQAHCSIVGVKSKIATLQAICIFRLELIAAVIGVRLKPVIFRAHRYIVTTTVIQWILSEHRRYKQFVAFLLIK